MSLLLLLLLVVVVVVLLLVVVVWHFLLHWRLSHWRRKEQWRRWCNSSPLRRYR